LARTAKGATTLTSNATQDGAGNIATKFVASADIVILGAGYGGLHVAQRLARLLRDEHKADGAPWTVLLVDRQSHHQLTTELPWLVNNEVTDDSLDIPLDQLLDGQQTRLLQAEIHSIRLGADSQPGAIETSVGAIAYNQLVMWLAIDDQSRPGRAILLALAAKQARQALRDMQAAVASPQNDDVC
jgi:hypothetical protein